MRLLHSRSSVAIDPRELQDLQRLLKKASDAGLVDGNLAMKKAGGKSVNVQQASSSGAMTDASKRRLVEQEIQDDHRWILWNLCQS